MPVVKMLVAQNSIKIKGFGDRLRRERVNLSSDTTTELPVLAEVASLECHVPHLQERRKETCLAKAVK